MKTNCGFIWFLTNTFIGYTFAYVSVYSALANDTTSYDDPSVYEPLQCGHNITVDPSQVIYMRFETITGFQNVNCFAYSHDTNLYEEVTWDYYSSADYRIVYTIVEVKTSNLYNCTFTLFNGAPYKCVINVVMKTNGFPTAAVISTTLAVLILIALAVYYYLYRRNKNEEQEPNLVPQETTKYNYYENINMSSDIVGKAV